MPFTDDGRVLAGSPQRLCLHLSLLPFQARAFVTKRYQHRRFCRPISMKGRLCRVWDGLHVSPRTAPSKRAKLCTYFAWFLRPSQLKTVPYFELPMPISRVQLLMQFRMGSHALPVEQGRLAKPAVPRHLRRCTLCGTRALGDERHFVFDCPHFAHIRRQFRSLYQDADGTMQCFGWHKNQKAVCHCLAAILNLADDSNKDASS